MKRGPSFKVLDHLHIKIIIHKNIGWEKIFFYKEIQKILIVLDCSYNLWIDKCYNST